MIQDLLLIESLDIGALMENYRLFFMGLLPGVFMVALIVEQATNINPEGLLKRAFISIVLLSCVGVFYHKSVSVSMEAAEEALELQRIKNPLLMDMLEGKVHTLRAGKSVGSDRFFGEGGFFSGTLKFFRYHLFGSAVNDAFTLGVMFITKICFVILKIVYSLVYWLGLALFGIPCLIHLLPGMAGVLRGALTSFLWSLALPHVLVVILSIIGSEINRGYTGGQVIGDSIAGTALLFVMALMVAFVPLITSFILSGGGVSHAGSVIAAMGVNLAANLPKRFANKAANALVTKAPPAYRISRRGRNNFNKQKGVKTYDSTTKGESSRRKKIHNQQKGTKGVDADSERVQQGNYPRLSKSTSNHNISKASPRINRGRRHHPANIDSHGIVRPAPPKRRKRRA